MSYTAFKGQFGKLNTFLVMIPPEEIVEIVGHDPRGMKDPKTYGLSEKTKCLYADVQRTILKNKVEDIQEYVEKYSQADVSEVGALPAIAVGLKNPPKFKISKKLESEEGVVGNLILLNKGIRDSALILDGLKRICAILDLQKDKKLGPISLAVMLFCPRDGEVLTDADLAQLFYDFNSKATPIPRNVAVNRDGRDPHITIARHIGECEAIKINGGLEVNKRGNKSKGILKLETMVSFVRAAADGEQAVEKLKKSLPDSNIINGKFINLEQDLITFIEAIIAGMTPAKFVDRVNSIHLMAPIWISFGVMFHELYCKHGVRGPLLTDFGVKLGQLGWDRNAQRLEDHMREKNGKRIPKIGGSVMRRHLVKQMILELNIGDLTPAAAAE